MFCKHKWEVIEEWKEPSPVAKHGVKSANNAPYDIILETYCIKQGCVKCGKVTLETKPL